MLTNMPSSSEKRVALWGKIGEDIDEIISSEAKNGGVFLQIKNSLHVIMDGFSEKIGKIHGENLDKAMHTTDKNEMSKLYEEHKGNYVMDMLIPSVPEVLAKNENIPYTLLEKMVEEGRTVGMSPMDLINHKDTPKEMMDEFCKHGRFLAIERVLLQEKFLPLSSLDHLLSNKALGNEYNPYLEERIERGIEEKRTSSFSMKEIDEILGEGEDKTKEGTISEKIAAVLTEGATRVQFQSLYTELSQRASTKDESLVHKMLGGVISRPEEPHDKLERLAAGTPANRYVIDMKDQIELSRANKAVEEVHPEKVGNINKR